VDNLPSISDHLNMFTCMRTTIFTCFQCPDKLKNVSDHLNAFIRTKNGLFTRFQCPDKLQNILDHVIRTKITYSMSRQATEYFGPFKCIRPHQNGLFIRFQCPDKLHNISDHFVRTKIAYSPAFHYISFYLYIYYNFISYIHWLHPHPYIAHLYRAFAGARPNRLSDSDTLYVFGRPDTQYSKHLFYYISANSYPFSMF